MEADIIAVSDGGETVALMEPMVIAEESRHRGDSRSTARALSRNKKLNWASKQNF